jgi:hypothetical protein
MTTLSPELRGTRTVRKITRKRIDIALEVLRKTPPSDGTVHEARKSLKKARAGLRLLRSGLKQAIYREENAALRDAARPLSAVRDAEVLSHTLTALLTRYGAPASTLRLASLRRAIKHHRSAAHHTLLRQPAGLADSRRLLRKTRARVAALSIQQHDWAVLGTGLQRVYAQGRRAMTRVHDRPAAEEFHEWRKQIKLGSRLFDEKPKHFVARFGQYWRQWRRTPPAT